MGEEKKSKKKNSRLTTTITVSTYSSETLTKYSKANRISKMEVLDTLIGYLAEPGATLSMLDNKYQLSIMNNEFKKNQIELVSILKKSKNDSLEILEKNNTNNLKFIDTAVNKIVQVKTDETIITTQNFILLRALVAAELEDQYAKPLLQKTLAAIQDSQKSKEQKAVSENKIQPQINFTIAGRIGMIPKIDIAKKDSRVYCLLTLGTKNNSSNNILWYNVNLWEGTLTQKLGLTNQESIKSYFSKLNKGDVLKLQGSIRKDKRMDESGKEVIIETYIATEILEHISYSEKK